MFNIEQTTKQAQSVATGFSINQANYINLNSPRDKQILVYVTISFDDGSSKDETITFAGDDYNTANDAFSSWAGLISVVEEKLGLKLTIPENIEEVFQNQPAPVDEVKLDDTSMKVEQSEEVTPASIEPVPLPADEGTQPLE
jgi:hypothetical protein